MRIAYSLGSLLTINQVLECSEILSHTNTDTIWIPETWGMENFSMLSMVSQKASKPKIGSSIINIYSRSPSSIAMGAATVDALSNGRLILGLGTSSTPIVEDFHGYKFENQVLRMKEY
ncbi:MAG: LLM class flavin-dependent oxidoreductase, partial [Thermoproteota archaeon]